jgi:hypothetical protein
MSPQATWSEGELHQLAEIMRRNFGPCRCGKLVFDQDGDLVFTVECPGHGWLREPHRAARLFWIKRTALSWVLAEHIL